MSSERSALTADELGPVDHLVIEFIDGLTSGEGFEVLLELVSGGVIYVLDLEFVERTTTGEVRLVYLAALPNPQAVDLGPLEGSSSGLLDGDDVRAVGATIEPGTFAAVLVYENLFAERLTGAFGRSGGRVVSRNTVSVDDLSAAFDRVEANDL